MKRVHAALLIAFLLGCAWAPIVLTEAMPREQAIQECFAELKISDADQKIIQSPALFATKFNEASAGVKCYSLCFFKKMDMLDANGNIKHDEVKAAVERHSALNGARVIKNIDTCQNPEGSNECEVTFNYAACIHAGA